MCVPTWVALTTGNTHENDIYVLPDGFVSGAIALRGAVNIFVASYRRRAGALLKPPLFLCMISLIKNALWPVTLQALYSQKIGNV